MTREETRDILKKLSRKEHKPLLRICMEIDVSYQTLYRYMHPERFPVYVFRARIIRSIERYIMERQSLWQKE